MKKRVFIIHGWGASPEANWFPWMKTELEKHDFMVSVPQMPHADFPKQEEWVKHMQEVVGNPGENTYFIGHSIGCQAIMRYLQTVDKKVGGVLFVAGWFVLNNLDEEDKEIARPWIETPIDFEKLKSASKNYTLLISDNDPFGGFEENKKSFERMDAKIITMKGAGHIQDRELPIALEELLKIVK